ncbi:MAG: hypothetical protein AB8G05_27545 [Oligoflexales bacterium]
MFKMLAALLMSGLISSSLLATENTGRYPVTIVNSSTKHVGVNMQGRLFLLKCNNNSCVTCANSGFSNSANVGISGPTKIKATYGSFKNLSKKGYKQFPVLSKNTFIAIETAAVFTTAFAMAGYHYPAMQTTLSNAMKGVLPANINRAKYEKSVGSLADCVAKSYKDPVIVGAINVTHNVTNANPFGTLWSVLSLKNSVQQEALVQAIHDQLSSNNTISEQAKEELTKILKQEGFLGWFNGTVTIDRKKVSKWQEQFGAHLSPEELESVVKSKLKELPGNAAEIATELCKSSFNTAVEGTKYAAGETCKFIVENPKQSFAIGAGVATGVGAVAGIYYLCNCNDECVVTPPNDDEDYVTLVNIYDGNAFGISIGISHRNR